MLFIRRQFLKRFQHKKPVTDLGMRYGEFRSADNKIIIEEDIEIYRSGTPPRAGFST
jgi:hypothetical protein